MINIPAILNNEHYCSIDTLPLTAVNGERIGEMCQVPFIRMHELNELAHAKHALIQQIPVAEILRAMKQAAALLRGNDWSFTLFSKQEYCRLVAASTGLPLAAMEEEIEEMADLLENMEQVIAVQLPATIERALDAHEFSVPGNKVGYYPAGKSLLIKIPGNIPTICVYWLAPLAMKRPVILVPPAEDPFTHLLLLQAIKKVNDQLSSCIQFLPAEDSAWSRLLDSVEQVLLPESAKSMVTISPARILKTYFIHYGRTKLLVPGEWDDEAVQIAFRRMTWKYGRTCTGLTSIIVRHNAKEFAEQLANLINRSYNRAFEDNPLFNSAYAKKLNEVIESYISRGEVQDITKNSPRMMECDGKAMFLPTVLLVKQKKSQAFGWELPFPFVTIAEAADENEMIELAKNTLILSVLTNDRQLVHKLCSESSIRKVFAGTQVERGYNYMDPHEGYMADFLYHKKAVAY